MFRFVPPLVLLAACAPAVERPAPAPAAAPTAPAAGIAGVAGAGAVEAMLLRRWVSLDDPAQAITLDRGVDGYTFGTQTNGLTDSVEPMRFVADCDGRAAAAADGGSFVVGGAGTGAADGARCYRILALGPGELVLSSLPRGNTLRYAPG